MTVVPAEVLSRFDLGAPASETFVGEGMMGRVWKAETSQGSFAIKRLHRAVDPVAVERDCAFQELALSQGIRLPRPVRARDGGVLARAQDADWRVYEWMECSGFEGTEVTPALALEIGATLARIHALGAPASEVSPWLATPPATSTWEAFAARAKEQCVSWYSAVESARTEFAMLAADAAGSPSPPPRRCHNDLIPQNVGRHPDGGLVVLDWEHSGAQAPEHELGYVLTHWCVLPTGKVDVDAARALLRGYLDFADEPVEVGPGTFRSAVCSMLNYTVFVLNTALSPDPVKQKAGEAMLAQVLPPVLNRSAISQLVEALRPER
ncbi:phosphotransferase [Actinopolymorpha pittospori]